MNRMDERIPDTGYHTWEGTEAEEKKRYCRCHRQDVMTGAWMVHGADSHQDQEGYHGLQPCLELKNTHTQKCTC